jgi:hypothetical protein
MDIASIAKPKRARPGFDSTPPSVPEPVIPPELTASRDEPDEPEVEREDNGRITPNGARALVQARWATEQAAKDDLVTMFTDCEIEDGMALLARMREMCELAARTLEKRRTEETENTKCSICGVTKKKLGNRNWRMVKPKRDPKTLVLVTEYFCSDACIVEGNRREHGISAMSDRGMLPGDDPSRAKNSIIAHQERVKAEFEMQEANRKIREGK